MKFVYFGYSNSYNEICFMGEEKVNKCVYYCKYPTRKLNPFLRLFFRVHNSASINRHFHLPFRKIWKKIFINDIFDKVQYQEDVIFIFSTVTDIMIKTGVLKYIKEHFYNSKIVYYFEDVVQLRLNYDKHFFEKHNKFVDMYMSYNPKDCSKYNLVYSSQKIFNLNNILVDSKEIKYDVFFVGKAKDRYNELIKLFETFKRHNLKCLFFINGVPKNQQKYPEEIIYNRFIDYKEVVKYVISSKAILNFSQSRANGLCLRENEAISLNKILITNNHYFENSKYFKKEKVIFIENIETELYKINDNSDWPKVEYGNFEYYNYIANMVNNLKKENK